MKYMRSVVLAAVALAIVAGGQGLRAKNDSDNDHRVRQKVTVSFGAGLNQPGALNQHIMPQSVKVRTTLATATTPAIPGVVNFIVSGFHQIFVYNPGVTPAEITAFIGTSTALFINDLNNLFYEGINPIRLVNGVPTYNDNTPTPNPQVLADGNNRVESVGFTLPGTYLIICNVRPHFANGMIAWVKVVTDDEDHNDDHGDY
jgi:plastocyanin